MGSPNAVRQDSRESSPPMETAAQPARNERPETHRSRPGRPFAPGNPGKPKGARTKASLIGIEVMRAMAGRASARIEALVDSPSPNIALEAVSYTHLTLPTKRIV